MSTAATRASATQTGTEQDRTPALTVTQRNIIFGTIMLGMLLSALDRLSSRPLCRPSSAISAGPVT